MGATKRFMEDVEAKTVINWDSIEPTDSEGYEMEGIAIYENKKYPIELRAISELTYEEQAARQITDKLLQKPTPKQNDDKETVTVGTQTREGGICI